jgi:2-phosphosulfolactate phosphatase
MFFDQGDYDIRCEWGERGISSLSPISDVVIIVDVLSFSTCVDIAVSRGATVFPYRWRDETAAAHAVSLGAVLANPGRPAGGYSLSPTSLLSVPPGTRLVLPSPNGSTLTVAAEGTPTLTGCLRNAEAVAQTVRSMGKSIAVIPAGERWPDGSLRPSLEDMIGAGAIIHHMLGTKSPEAEAAECAFEHAAGNLLSVLERCSSGKELIERGFREDVELAAALNVSGCAPVVVEGAYIQQQGQRSR